MIRHKDCKGCRLKRTLRCVYREANIAQHCPCLQCLVKVICNKSLCSERRRAYNRHLHVEPDKMMLHREYLGKRAGK